MTPRYPLLIGGAAAAVLVGSALTPPAASAEPAPEIQARSGTAAPALVSGLSEKARSKDPVAAARAHLANSRYRIGDPNADLTPLNVVRDGADETVRLQQRHRGLPVLGGHYLVHFRTEGGTRKVVGAGGRFQTALTVPTTPTVAENVARGVALAQFADTATLLKAKARPTAQNQGLVVLPRGGGQLTWKFLVRGEVGGATALREVYVDARTGAPALVNDRLRHAEGPVEATGRTAHGKDVTLNAYQRADGKVELRDRKRGAEIVTYDAEKREVGLFEGGPVPAGTKVAASDSTVFGPAATETGAVDAHWAAGQVYDYYKALGRNGLDDKNGPIQSVVNVTSAGRPYANAFWDGTKMVYGGGGQYHSFAAALDVDGHEMTHGVVEHTANLVYFGQAGAMNEGLADYFGNAIETNALGVDSSAPDAGLLGEGLCKTGTPRQCAIRDLNDNRVADRDYIGLTGRYDNAGVHLNSTIFSGALWDVREKIGKDKADKVVYKALAEYMTPLDDFTDGRRAVEAAAKALKLGKDDRRVIRAAFDAHGIKAGWEKAIPNDAKLLLPNVTAYGAKPAAGGDNYAIAQSDGTRTEPAAVYTGTAKGGYPSRFSPKTGGTTTAVDTDGKTVVWGELNGATGISRVYTRPFHRGGKAVQVAEYNGRINDVSVDGDKVTYTTLNHAATEADAWLKVGKAAPVNLTPSPADLSLQATVKGGKAAYVKLGAAGQRIGLYDVATAKETLVASKGTVQWPTLTRSALLFTQNAAPGSKVALIRTALDGTGATTLINEDDKLSWLSGLDANDKWVTVGVFPGANSYANENMPKLFQLPLAGGALKRVSCNRGEQGTFASASGRGALWIDGSQARPDLVTRSKPTGATCA